MKTPEPQIKIDEIAFSRAKTVLGTDFEVSKEYGRESNRIHRLQWLNGKIPISSVPGYDNGSNLLVTAFVVLAHSLSMTILGELLMILDRKKYGLSIDAPDSRDS